MSVALQPDPGAGAEEGPVPAQGDVLVRRVRGQAGRTLTQRRTLATLGVRKIGQARVHSSGRRLDGMVRAVHHIVTVEALTVDVGFGKDAATQGRGGEIVTIAYERAHGTGMLYRASDDDWLRVEVNDDHYGMSWTTRLPLGSALARLGELLPSPPLEPETAVVMWSDGRESLGSAREVLGQVREDVSSVVFVRLDFPTMSLTWSGVTHPRTRVVSDGKFGLVAWVYDPDLWVTLLRLTATLPIGEAALELSEKAAFVAERFEKGNILTK